ncbi:hypothetical protein T01_10022 [Trichinella spiralis]|uniref:Uncharacterized protein n=1 Tax=Trichinella spiralis TaxID=6334 RepID=A0A0V1B3A0_TRISP|nr:hypothetical protein T01_10022 [Trichinella spiralis]
MDTTFALIDLFTLLLFCRFMIYFDFILKCLLPYLLLRFSVPLCAADADRANNSISPDNEAEER